MTRITDTPSNGKPRVVATYGYTDAAGKLLFEVVRFEPKDFRQRTPDGNGGWRWGLNGTAPVLYRLDKLASADPAEAVVFIVEGEKDVSALESLGLLATTNPMGANKWKLSYSESLRGFNVFIVADNDDPGRKHADAVAKALAGIAASIAIVELPGLPHKGDISDWLAMPGNDRANLLQLCEDARKRQRFTFATGDAYEDPGDRSQPEKDECEPLPIITAGALMDAHPRLREPIIDGLLRVGETLNLISSPKVGKSWLSLSLALSVASGRMWLDFPTMPGRVLLIDNELHPETIASRLRRMAEATGTPMQTVRESIDVLSLRGRLHDLRRLARGLKTIERGKYTLLIIDAFYRTLPMATDENSNGTMAELYNVIDEFADHLQAGTVPIHHSTKGSQSEKAVTDVGAGAGAQARATDTHLILRPHESDGIYVLDAAVRSFPPIAPRCLRWEWPLWTAAPECDPTLLRSARSNRRKLADAEPPTPAEPPWTAKRFADAFGKPEPRPRAALIDDARILGLSDRRAEILLRAAVDCGFLHAWRADGQANRMLVSSAPRPKKRRAHAHASKTCVSHDENQGET